MSLVCAECFEPIEDEDDIDWHADLHQVGTDGVAVEYGNPEGDPTRNGAFG